MKNKVLVSVIVPVYNVEKYLDKCLNSLANQTLKDIEIIIINDGTKDNSQKIIDKFCKKYNNFTFYIKENGGLSSARNYGLKYANGEYIGFVDSDDYVDESMFKDMYEYAVNNNKDIVVCDTINVYSKGHSYRTSNLNYSEDIVKNYIISPPMACIRLYSNRIKDKLYFEEGIFYEDLNLIPSLVKYTKNVGFLENAYYYYLMRDNSIMKQRKFSDRLLDIFKVLDNNYKLLYSKYPEEIEYLYITHLLRTATLRFLSYDKILVTKCLEKINDEMKQKFPNWKKNKYLKLSSFKLKIICYLAYNKKYNLLKILMKIKK
ncbi:MAG: glycosyltransferase [Tenericutes bacterium]|nr:glycosyltransferase [Mycoplasmatota bacterium]